MRCWLLLLCLLSACREAALRDLSEADANRALLALSAAGINAQRETSGERSSLWVSSSDLPAALSLLSHYDLPKPPKPACQPTSLFPSPIEELEAQRACRAYEIARSLEQIMGLRAVRVILSTPDTETEAAALLYQYEEAPRDDEVRAFAATSLGLPADKLSLHATKAPSAAVPDLEQVGPFLVSSTSKPSLLITLGALLLLLLSALGLSALLWSRQRRLQKPGPS